MTDNSPSRPLDPRAVTTMLDLGVKGPHTWTLGELSELLQHTLDAPPQVSLGSEEALDADWAAQGITCLRDLLTMPCPPLALIALAKEIVKRASNNPESDMPREIAMLLYYATVAAALLRCSERISGLTGDALRQAVAWAHGRRWIDAPLRNLFADALDHLNDTPPGRTRPESS